MAPQTTNEHATGEPASPCRLFVYLAREAPIGVVLRRGPSRWARLSLWHTETDTFEHGQWVTGRVYERRCDVSVDGSLFLAFARGSGGSRPENRDSWVAVSRPPWFTALALWFVGGTYCTGGFFLDRRSLWLGFTPDPPDHGRLPKWLSATTALPPYVDRTYDSTDRMVWVNRLLRDGWAQVAEVVPETWQHHNPEKGLTLVMTLRSNADFGAYGGRHVVEYAVRSEARSEVILLGRATWADWDHFGRLVIAQNGQLWHWQQPGTLRELMDFNPHVPEPSPAPARARMWPRRPSQAR